jgi:hypothetical protein
MIACLKSPKTLSSSGFIGFGPPRFGCFSGATAALFVCHSLKPALATDPAALGAHLPHDLLDYSKIRGLSGFQQNTTSLSGDIKFLISACPLWHISKRCTDYRARQEGAISNRPTTRAPASRLAKPPSG